MIVTLLTLLDWAMIAVSFFNTIVFTWLGLTVLLNAERRSWWGTWVAGVGLLFGGAFFAGHSAVVGRVLGTFSGEMELWWRFGWLPFIAGPYLWYGVIATYTGVLRSGRHRAALLVITLLGVTALLLLVAGDPLSDPLPSYGEMEGRGTPSVIALGGIPVALLIYPVYSVLCIVLAISALRRPAASARFMGDAARRRARPWLLAASLVLLAVSLSVGAAAAWVLLLLVAGRLPGPSLAALALLIGFDLLIAGLIGIVAVLIGQAIVRYEIFTGKTLPRGGLQRYWRRTLILAAGYGTLIGGTLALPIDVDPIYRLLLATLLMTLFFALLSWRSYLDREWSIAQLRPFVASQRLYEHLLRPAEPAEVDVAAPLRALCDGLLGARSAHLAALGPLAPLVGPVAATAGAAEPLARDDVLALAGLAGSPDVICAPVDPARYGGAVWAVPLWSQRGLIGALLLGPKRDGALYTQEEIEIARAAGERLIDTCASAEMARRLMALQRRRLAEDQVADRRARRVLHDEVLPQIHAALLALGSWAPPTPDAAGEGARQQALALLSGAHRQISDLLRAMPAVAAPELAQAGIVGALRRTVEHELGDAFDRVEWSVAPEVEQADRQISPLVAEVGYYAAREAVRNAARHGRGGDGARPLQLTVGARLCGGLELSVADDGVGTESAVPREGHGLALHSTLLAVVGATLTIESAAGRGTRVTISLPRDGGEP